MVKKGNRKIKQNFYVVQSIIGKRQKEGVIEYKVRWKGYSDNDATWEPIQNLSFVLDLLEDYNDAIMGIERPKLTQNQRQKIQQEYEFLQESQKELVEPKKRKLAKPDWDFSPSQSYFQQNQQQISQKFKQHSTPIKPKPSCQRKSTIKNKKSNLSEKAQFHEEQIPKVRQQKLMSTTQLKQLLLKNQTEKTLRTEKQKEKKIQTLNLKQKQKEKQKEIFSKRNLVASPVYNCSELKTISDYIQPQQKIRRINHVLIKDNTVLYQVQYQPMLNKPIVDVLPYDKIPLCSRQLIPKYYQKVLLLLHNQSMDQSQCATQKDFKS